MPERPPFARLAVVGLPGAGKTSLFCALTGVEYARAVASSGKVLSGSVRVEDSRLLRIHEQEHPQAKLTCPILEVLDTPPLQPEGRGIFAQFRNATAILIVLKAYDSGAEVESQLESIRSELLLSDAELLQRRIEKIDDRLKRSVPTKEREQLQAERDAVAPLVESITGETKIDWDSFSPEVKNQLRSFQLFAQKPIFPLVNIAEKDLGTREGTALKLELELLGMEEGERAEYMKDYGLDHLTTERLPVDFPGRLNFLTFLTVGEKGVVGWCLPRGSTAPEAAGFIHTDIEKGFINAEVISYADREKAGSIREAERTGKKRLEGKNYVVQDWDILNIRFNV